MVYNLLTCLGADVTTGRHRHHHGYQSLCVSKYALRTCKRVSVSWDAAATAPWRHLCALVPMLWALVEVNIFVDQLNASVGASRSIWCSLSPHTRHLLLPSKQPVHWTMGSCLHTLKTHSPSSLPLCLPLFLFPSLLLSGVRSSLSGLTLLQELTAALAGRKAYHNAGHASNQDLWWVVLSSSSNSRIVSIPLAARVQQHVVATVLGQ